MSVAVRSSVVYDEASKVDAVHHSCWDCIRFIYTTTPLSMVYVVHRYLHKRDAGPAFWVLLYPRDVPLNPD
jgi:hypothetical protein